MCKHWDMDNVDERIFEENMKQQGELFLAQPYPWRPVWCLQRREGMGWGEAGSPVFPKSAIVFLHGLDFGISMGIFFFFNWKFQNDILIYWSRVSLFKGLPMHSLRYTAVGRTHFYTTIWAIEQEPYQESNVQHHDLRAPFMHYFLGETSGTFTLCL